MPDEELCAQARRAYQARAWADAHELFLAADARVNLPAADLERWGLAAFLCGQDALSDRSRERAHYAFLDAQDADGAARVAFWLGLALILRGEAARGGGWFARMHTVGTDAGTRESVWTGYHLVTRGMRAFFSGDLDSGLALAGQASAVAQRFDDLELRILVGNGRGQIRVASGDLSGGLAELDEVMVLATTSDVSPQLIGLVSCAVLNACRECMDVARSIEWTSQLSRWCEAQPGLVAYRGQCLVHRSELLQLQGHWDDARAEISRVLDRLARFPAELAAGDAHYQLGELHRVRGEHDHADVAYRQALQQGRDPQPGLALLRFAQGRADAGLVAIARALNEVTHQAARTRLLAAAVEIALAVGDASTAGAATRELQQLSAALDSPYLNGVAAMARGSAALAEGRADSALTALREALDCWTTIDAPYDAARCRLLISGACAAAGDTDTAALELDAARATLSRLCSATEVDRLVEQTGSLVRSRSEAVPHALTPREVEVLRLLATGGTNRAIADALFLSEKTVARHVANIFMKIHVSSRAAATAYAFAHHLA